MTNDKALFIPLKQAYFDAFERGDKTSELRVYGPRWNITTCTIGRAVTLSCGYGKQRRLQGIIVDVEIRDASKMHDHREALMNCYGRLDMEIIIIHIQVPALKLLH